MTVRQCAAEMRVSESVVRAWIAAGLLPHYRLGMPGRRGKISVERADLDAFRAGRKVGGGVPEPVNAPRPPQPALKHVRLS